MSTEGATAMATTGPGRAACPLCSSTLPQPNGPVELDETGRRVRFRHCPRCRALVPDGLDSAVEGDPFEATESARRPPAGVVCSATGVAWEMAEHLPAPARSGLIIDLGMGRGAIANALLTLGYTVMGCEPSAFSCQMARASYLLGPAVLTNTDPDRYLTDLEAEATTASAVVLWHVADRHPDPVGLLRRCRRLVPDGLLFTEWPTARADSVLAEQRLHPTPATIVHLAQELDLVAAAASITESGMRVVFRVPANDVIDLDRGGHHELDIPALEAAYRAVSPVFASVVPVPATVGTDADAEVSSQHRPS